MLVLDTVTASGYYRSYKDENGFHAEIIMNPRDAMVLAEIKSLPESKEHALSAVSEFQELVIKKYGAKTCISIDPELIKTFSDFPLQPKSYNAAFIDKDTIAASIEEARHKPHIALQLEKFETGEYKLLDKEVLRERTAELSDFKIRYSSFVNADKINRGQYSEKAEEDKLMNPYSEHFAIEHNGKIIACMMDVISGRLSYDADFVVHPDYRSTSDKKEGVGQTLCIKMYDALKNKYEHVEGVWLIPGGYGLEDVGAHLYGRIFPTQNLKEKAELQKQIGLYVAYGAPGEELLKAANRSLETSNVLSEEKYVKDALQILSESLEPNLAAKQPEIKVEKAEKVVGISMFTQIDKTPRTTPASPPEKKSDLVYGRNDAG